MVLVNDLNRFKSLYKIPVNAIPNQEFSFSLDSFVFRIKIQTFNSGASLIWIWANEELICNGLDFKAGVNLNFLSNFRSGVFFFLQENQNYFNTERTFFNFSNLNQDLGLYYGAF